MPELQVSKLFQTAEETKKPETVLINGSIPSYVNGIFLRTGPAKWDLDNGNFTVNHAIDGFAMISKFQIESSTQVVKFEKRFLESDSYKRGMIAQRPVITEFGTHAYPDPTKSFFSKMISACLPLELSDNNGVNLFQIGREIFTTGETCFFRSLDKDSLNTCEKYDSNKCFGLNIDSAHPLTDETGTTYQMGSTFITGLKYNLVKIPPPASNQTAKEIMKKSKIITSISSSWNGLMSCNHQSFTLTKDHVIFIEQPYVVNIAKAAKSILKGSPIFRDYVEWRPELKNRFYVIEKATGKVIKTEFFGHEAFFFVHIVNAYSVDNQIILDLISYPNADCIDELYLDRLRAGCPAHAKGSLHRYVIPVVDTKSVEEGVNLVEVKSDALAIRHGSSIILTPEVISEPGIENPILNKKKAGKENNYFYACGNHADSQFRNSCTKFDTKKKNCVAWNGLSTQITGEPQFIQNPNGKDEDDGVLIVPVTDSRHDANDFLVFLDAKNMEEIGRATFQNNVPYAVHGIFVQD